MLCTADVLQERSQAAMPTTLTRATQGIAAAVRRGSGETGEVDTVAATAVVAQTSRQPIPDAFTQWRDKFPPDEALQKCADRFNRDLRNELTGKPFNLTEAELARVPWVQPSDPRIMEVLGTVFGITGPGQTVTVDNTRLDRMSEIVHSTVNPALTAVGRAPSFRHIHRNCVEVAEAQDAQAMIEACGCKYKGSWTHHN